MYKYQIYTPGNKTMWHLYCTNFR